ncbi:hypothetical protein OIO90_003510 [Microbotryomycetes sp. JL221]|nr:hypothetical protein OIO90_003510 [Microbotryomycetes sp. JL221]
MPPSYCLAVNCGSSSIKFKVFEVLDDAEGDHHVLVAGSASNVQGDKPAKYAYKWASQGSDDGSEPKLDYEDSRELDSETAYEDVFERILADVTDERVLGHDGKDKIRIVAHRIVHGGTADSPIVIKHGDKDEQKVLDDMDKVSDFAPLHNHHAMLIVKKCLESLPQANSVLCFDTLFHQTIPDYRTTYAISQPLHKTPVPLRRFGFHGLSYGSIVKKMSRQLKVHVKELNLIVAHLGSGGSTCLIQEGKSVNTSMGVTPLEGLPGGTRSGTLDPSLIFHHTKDCSETVEWSGRQITKAEFVLNKESGFKALTGTSDFGEITERAKGASGEDQKQSQLAYNLYLDRLMLYLSSYISSLFSSAPPNNKLHALVFSGGIGEHSVEIRRDVLQKLSWVEKLDGSGGGIDNSANEEATGTRSITKQGSKIVAWVVETDEELESVQLSAKAVQESA